jgi:hypothetical protein
MKSNNFSVTVCMYSEDAGSQFLKEVPLAHLSNSVMSWESKPFEHGDDLDIDESSLESDEDDIIDEEESTGDTEGEDTVDDEDDWEPPEHGSLKLHAKLSPSVVADYRQYTDNPYSLLSISILYRDDDGTPVFTHKFECDSMMMFHESGSKDSELPLVQEIFAMYVQSDYFVKPDNHH